MFPVHLVSSHCAQRQLAKPGYQWVRTFSGISFRNSTPHSIPCMPRVGRAASARNRSTLAIHSGTKVLRERVENAAHSALDPATTFLFVHQTWMPYPNAPIVRCSVASSSEYGPELVTFVTSLSMRVLRSCRRLLPTSPISLQALPSMAKCPTTGAVGI